MKIVKQVAASCLISFSFACFLMTADYILNQDKNSVNRNAAIDRIIFSIPTTIASGWLMKSLSRQQQQKQEEHLRSLFFDLLRQNNGRITALDLAMVTNLSGSAATEYIEKRANEFMADSEITATGHIIYQFPVTTNNWQAIAYINALKELEERSEFII